MSSLSASFHALELDRVLTLVAMEAKSAAGKAAVMHRRPMQTVEACESAHADLSEMVRFFLSEGLLPMAGLTDVEALFARETVLELDESWIVVRAARTTQAIRETLLRTAGYVRLAAIAGTIPDLSEILTKLGRYFTREGKLREDASPELRAIRNKVHQKRGAIQRVLTDVMNRSAEAIQEPLIVMRGDRYCIPVRSDHRNAVTGILHERSGSGASFFIEPIQAVELNNDLADLLIQEREEIARITLYIAQLLAGAREPIADAVGVAGELDALQACAIFHSNVKAARPQFSARRELRLLNGRHPLLDERLAAARAEAFGEQPDGADVVPVTIELDEQSAALIISGPNAGGKTVALKTAGLLVAMATSGLPVPADDGTVIPVVDDLHVLIGDDQSVLEHLSTFSAYLVRLRRILERATERSMVLLDELGSGTDPEEGSALAAAVVEFLLQRGALLIVTTHLSALKSFAVNDGRIVNASMEFDSATGQPSYRMISGIPGRSRAIEVAERIGLPSPVIASARERLGDRYGETDTLLAELQKSMSSVLRQRAQLEEAQQALAEERSEVAARAARLERERASLGGSYRDELERLKDDVSRQLANEIRNLRELDKNARASLNANAVVQSVTRTIENAIEFLPSEERVVRAGDQAEHRKFKVKGKVVSIDGKRAVLDVNGRRMNVETRDLTPIGGGDSMKPAKSRISSGASAPSDIAPIGAELNLIGARVDEALEASDKFLDRSLLEGKQAVRIIHGFGTGTLRKAIREHLRRHPAVRSWRPGADNEGGDGATIAVLE